MDYSFSTYTTEKTEWAPGQIEIRIPLHILKDREGNYADAVELAIPAAEMEAQLTDEHVFVYKIVENEADPSKSYVAVYNRVPADPTQVGYFEVSYVTTKETFDYIDYGADNDESDPALAWLTIYGERAVYDATTGRTTVVMDRDADHLLDKESEKIPVNIDTTAVVTSVNKKAPATADRNVSAWKDAWGEAPVDADQYYYAVWEIETKITATQPYDFTLDDKLLSAQGAVVGYRMAESADGTFDTGAEANVVENCRVNYGDNVRKDYVLTRIEKDHYDALLESEGSYIVENEVVAKVHPTDQVDADSALPSKNHYEVVKAHYVIPAGTSQSEKKGLTTSYELSKLIAGEQTVGVDDNGDAVKEAFTEIDGLRYDAWFQANTWAETYEGEVGTDPDPRTDENNKDNFGKKKVTVELSDKKLWLRYFDHAAWENAGSPSAQNGYTVVTEPLQKDDYRFTAVDFSYVFMDGEYQAGAGFDPVSRSGSMLAKLANEDRLGDMVFTLENDGTAVTGEARYSFMTGLWSADNTVAALVDFDNSTPNRLVFAAGANITGYKLSNENALYSTKLETKPTVALKRGGAIVSQALNAIDKDSPEMQLWNEAEMFVRQDDSVLRHFTRSGMDDIIGDTRKSVINKNYTSRKNDTLNSRYLISWDVDMKETFSIDNTEQLVSQDSGVFYDLLPLGVEYIPGSLAAYRGVTKDGKLVSEALDQSQYSVQLESNYQGSGRMLMTVNFTDPGETYRMTYDTAITWDAILQQRGSDTTVVTAHNLVAYKTGNDDIGRYDNSYMYRREADVAAWPTDAVLYDLVRDPARVIMTARDCPVGALVSGTLGLQKTVRATANDAKYGKSAVTYAEGEYSYRLQFGPNVGSKARDLIVFDFLESFETGSGDELVRSDWYGTLKSVDTSLARAMGADPVVYYSTISREAMRDAIAADPAITQETFANLEYRFNDAPFWVPASEVTDLSKVTAVAVDLRRAADDTGEDGHFVLHGGKTVSVFVYLNAPHDAVVDPATHMPVPDARAYNDVYLNQNMTSESKSFVTGEDEVVNQGNTVISYRVVGSLNIKKVRFDDENTPIPGIKFHLKGTSGYGTAVDATLTTNSSGTLSFTDLELTDETHYYQLWEEDGVQDFQVDGSTVMTVRVNADGTATIEGLVKPRDKEAKLTGEKIEETTGSGATLTYWRITNKPRQWTDFEFTKLGAVDGAAARALPGVMFKLSGVSDYHNAIEKFAESDSLGRVRFEDVEQGAYKLEEFTPADGYAQANRAFRVVVSAARDVTMTLDGGDAADTDSVKLVVVKTRPDPAVDYEETSYQIIDEPLHDLGLIKVDAANSKVLAGAAFRLTGTSDLGTPVDMTAVSQTSGAVDFLGLEPGTYALRETVAPENHVLDDTLYTVTVGHEGQITITWPGGSMQNFTQDGDDITVYPLGATSGDRDDREPPANRFFYTFFRRFSMPNARQETGVITIKKVWLDKNGNVATQIKETTGLPVPVVELGTYVPEEPPKPARMRRNLWDKFVTDYNVKANARAFVPVGLPDDLNGWTKVSENSTDFPKSIYVRFNPDNQAIEWCTDTLEVYLPGDGVNCRQMFMNYTAIERIDMTGLKADYATYTDGMFQSCSNLTSLTLPRDFGTQNVTDMTAMFLNSPKLTSLDLSGMDFSSATKFINLFKGDHALRQVIFPADMNTSLVNDMQYMFQDCYALENIVNLAALDTENVANMDHMFAMCRMLGNPANGGLDLSSFDTSKVTDMKYMFEQLGVDLKNADGSAIAPTLDLSAFDTGKVTTMLGMFLNCKTLKNIDLSSFDTSSVTTMQEMFRGCEMLETLDLSRFITSNVTTMSNMFKNCKGLKSIDVSHFDTTSVDNMTNMFGNCQSLTTLDLSSFHNGAVTDTSYMFTDCYKLKTLILPDNFGTQNVTTMQQMFFKCEALEAVDLSGFDTRNVTSFYMMFESCYELKALDVSRFDTRSATTMYEMFHQCRKLETIDGLGGFDTSNCTTIFDMFSECYALKSVDVSSFTTGHMTDFGYIFNNCYALTEIDLSSFDTRNATNMKHLFNNCHDVTTIYVDSSRWSTDKVKDATNMFNSCNALVGGLGTRYSDIKEGSNKIYARVDGGVTAPGYLTEKTYVANNDTGATEPDATEPDATEPATAPLVPTGSRSLAAPRTVSLSGVIEAERLTDTDSYAPAEAAAYDAVYAEAQADEGALEIVYEDAPPEIGDEAENEVALEPETYEAEPDAALFAGELEAEIETPDEETPEVITNVTKTTSGMTVVGKDDGSFDRWIIDPDTGEWTYRFHVYDVPEQDEDGHTIATTYYVTEKEELGGVQYLAPFKWISQDAGKWYQQLEYVPGEAGQGVTVKNQKEHQEPVKGSLSLTKQVVDATGNTYKAGQAFSFTIKYVTADGTAMTEEFTLADGETKQWTNLQANSEYTIEEKLTDAESAVYDATLTASKGTIAEGTQVRVVATNTVRIPETGALEISKTVKLADNVTERDDAEFTFDIAMSNADVPLNGAYDAVVTTGEATASHPVQFTAGRARVTLADGQTIRITGLPAGAEYDISERAYENYALTEHLRNGEAVTGEPGAIVANAVQREAFTNTKQREHEYGGFTIAKLLGAGTEADADAAFAFRVELTGLKANATYAYRQGVLEEGKTVDDLQDKTFAADNSGTARLGLTLAPGETAWFTKDIAKLPVGASYQITELASDYIASFTARNADENGSVKQTVGANRNTQTLLSTYKEDVEKDERTDVVFTNSGPLHEVRIQKIDRSTLKLLSGAKLTIYAVTGEVEDDVEYLTLTEWNSFISGDRAATVERLRHGSYLLREIDAPSGYRLADDVRFDIALDGAVTHWSVVTEPADGQEKVVESGEPTSGTVYIQMIDVPYSVTVRKEDSDLKPVPGAYLEILRRITTQRDAATNETHVGDEESLLTFVTDASGETVISGLLDVQKTVGGVTYDYEYILRELSAPAGYALADDIRFKLDDSDETARLLVWNGAAWAEQAGLTLAMVDVTEFSFKKEWWDTAAEHQIDWDGDITVTISRDRKDIATGAVTADDGFAAQYTIHRDGTNDFAITTGAGYAMTGTEADGVYAFKVNGLPKYDAGMNYEYTYYVSEATVDGFQPPKYYFGGGEYQGRVASGGTIVNCMASYELPETGGPGTIPFTALGAALILLAAALLALKKRREE